MSLPSRGPLPRPDSLTDAARTLAEESFDSGGVSEVVFETDEFTSLCPRTHQPDYSTVIIRYWPAERCLESKSLKYYLWAYREHGAFCEALANQIANDVQAAIHPAALSVEVRQNVRGGLKLTATAVR